MEFNNLEHICESCFSDFNGILNNSVYTSYVDTCHLCEKNDMVIPSEDIGNIYEILKEFKKYKWREESIKSVLKS